MKEFQDIPLHDQPSSEPSSGSGHFRGWQWFRNAFAVDDPAEFEPTQEQKELVDDVCHWMVRRGLTTAALMGIEMHRPANYLLANVMHFFRPSVSLCLPLLHLLPIIRRALPDMKRYRAFAAMIENRGAADYITRRLEEIEAGAVGGRPSAANNETERRDASDHDNQPTADSR